MATSAEISSIFPTMLANFRPEKADGVNATILFNLEGDNGGKYWVKIADKAVTHGTGDIEAPEMTVRAQADDFYAIATGESNPMQAFMMGKIKVDDMGLGMKMLTIFQLN